MRMRDCPRLIYFYVYFRFSLGFSLVFAFSTPLDFLTRSLTNFGLFGLGFRLKHCGEDILKYVPKRSAHRSDLNRCV